MGTYATYGQQADDAIAAAQANDVAMQAAIDHAASVHIADLNTLQATQGQLAAANATIAALKQAEIDEDAPPPPPPPPPPPAPKMLFGTSAGPVLPASVSQVGAKRVRTYTPGQLGQAVALGLSTFHSRKVNQTALAARDTGEMSSVKAEFATMLRGVAAIDHERNNDQTVLANVLADAAEYQKAWVVFLEIIAQINGGRAPADKILTCPTTTGDVFNHPGGMDPWYVAGADLMGFDIYVPVNYSKAAAYADLKGKDWIVPEFGITTGGTPNPGQNDPAKAARIISDVALCRSFKRPPVQMYEFNNNSSIINGCPASIAALATLCALG